MSEVHCIGYLLHGNVHKRDIFYNEAKFCLMPKINEIILRYRAKQVSVLNSRQKLCLKLLKEVV